MQTHEDAIAALIAAGIPASRRQFVLGDTVVAPLGQPSTHNDITVYTDVAWLVPSEDGWRLEQGVGGHRRVIAYPHLAAACAGVVEIAQAFLPMRPCQTCCASALVSFGERTRYAHHTHWIAVHCEHCGSKIEADGEASLPDDLRKLELKRRGLWQVVVQPPESAHGWSTLRSELRLSIPHLAQLKSLLPGPVSRGTLAEATRLANALTSAQVRADVEQVTQGKP